MEFTYSDGGGGFATLAGVMMLFGIFQMIFWMIVGWRAMRAHEDLADTVRDMAIRQGQAKW